MDFDKIIRQSEDDRDYEEYIQLQQFICIHENNKKIISENDQYHMIMCLLEHAYQRKLVNNQEHSSDEIKHKWNEIKRYIRKIWENTSHNKYDTVVAKIAEMGIWEESAG